MVISEAATCPTFIANIVPVQEIGKISASQVLDGCPFFYDHEDNECDGRDCHLLRFLNKQKQKNI